MKDRLYIADKTGRIQVFDRDGNFIRSWRIPEVYSGKPVGLSISHDGLLIVCDTHYFRLLFYTPDRRTRSPPERSAGRTAENRANLDLLRTLFKTATTIITSAITVILIAFKNLIPTGNYICEIGGHGEAIGILATTKPCHGRRQPPLGGRRLQPSHSSF